MKLIRFARELTFAKCDDFPDVCQVEFDDSSWRSVDLPHDWAVELPFKNAPELPEHGGKPLGRDYPETSIGWYRRVFDLEAADADKRIAVEFDGVFRDAIVIFNGFYVGQNFSGYAPFCFDLTDLGNFGGKNVPIIKTTPESGPHCPDRLHYNRVQRLKEMGSNAYRTSHNPPATELLDACDRSVGGE